MVKTTQLGGTASDVTVAKTAHGLMMMTWRDPSNPLPDETAFEAIKGGIDALPEGAKMFINSGEFYSHDLSTANLELLARFFDKYPSYSHKVFLSVKGGNQYRSFVPDGSPENLRRSVDCINDALRGTKKLDLFECARVPTNVSVEEVIDTLAELIKEGKFSHIGMSECSAHTLKRAHSVYPISVVEIEVSPWSYEEETKKVIETAKELGIAVAAYAPLGRGFLTGNIKSPADLDEKDMRRNFTRFQEEYIKKNYAMVDALKAIAKKKNITPASLCIAWVGSLGSHVIPMPGSSNKTRTVENLRASDVELTAEDLAEIQQVIDSHKVEGDRYYGTDAKTAHLWA